MAQPDFVPIVEADRVRPVESLPTPRAWQADRPADLRGAGQPSGKLRGTPGPDQGYGLALGQRFANRLVLTEGEHASDAVAGCLGVALRRAALFGRAPVVFDWELAFSLWGFLGDAPADLVKLRRQLFQSAAHHYTVQREIADRIPDSTLLLTPAQIRERLADWRNLVDDKA